MIPDRNRAVNDSLSQYAQPVSQLGGQQLVACNRSLIERINELEARASNHEQLVGKAMEELYTRVAELERLVRG